MSVYSSISNDSNNVGMSLNSGCSYTTLGKYSAKAAGMTTGVSMPQPSFLLVPQYGGSDGGLIHSLQHRMNAAPQPATNINCQNTDYFNIQKAYGSCPNTFTSLAGVNCGRR
jgi:hypothetical protein